jgi:hypothetical protein
MSMIKLKPVVRSRSQSVLKDLIVLSMSGSVRNEKLEVPVFS